MTAPFFLLMSRPTAIMPFHTRCEEDGFLKSLEPLNDTDIELLATNCTEVCYALRIQKHFNVGKIISFSIADNGMAYDDIGL